LGGTRSATLDASAVTAGFSTDTQPATRDTSAVNAGLPADAQPSAIDASAVNAGFPADAQSATLDTSTVAAGRHVDSHPSAFDAAAVTAGRRPGTQPSAFSNAAKQPREHATTETQSAAERQSVGQFHPAEILPRPTLIFSDSGSLMHEPAGPWGAFPANRTELDPAVPGGKRKKQAAPAFHFSTAEDRRVHFVPLRAPAPGLGE
jgi:hypothetical protein